MKLPQITFELESQNTPEFLSFARTFKNQLKKELEGIGAVLHKFNTGHFYLSGFFIKNEKYYYFSWHNGHTQLMYRTAQHDRDYTGGSNQWVNIFEPLKSQLVLK